MGDGTASGTSLMCPELVGRADEVEALRTRLGAAVDGRGGVVVLVGDAGAGKSRLVDDVVRAARAQRAEVLHGRAVPGANPVAYRALSEALLCAFRSAPPPDAPELSGFTCHLGRLVPHWRGDALGAGDRSPVLLSEAVVRLLATLGRGRGTVLVLEDLHWADAETLGAVDYFADAMSAEPVLCVCTTRPDPGTADILDRLERRSPGSTIRVSPLPDADVDRMVRACLGGSSPPPEVGEFVRAHADGNPFVVEELLAGVVAAGELVLADDGWTTGGVLTPTVPASVRESIRHRSSRLGAAHRRVLAAAALLGRRFEWDLLPGVAKVDATGVVEGLRAAVDAQLIEVRGDGFLFRHALTREAVLDDLLPPERRHLAERAWPAIERAHPDLSGPYCELAAELAEAAGAPVAAASRLVTSARRAWTTGALITAESAARRADRVAPDGDPVAVDAAEVLVRILVAAGKTGEALERGRRLVARVDASPDPPGRRADLLVVLARAAIAAGDPAGAALHVAEARAAAGAVTDGALIARIDGVAAHVSLDHGRLADADELARTAVAVAEASGQPDVQCEALEVLGRVARVREPELSDGWFERSAEVAERHGLAGWHLRARHELALSCWSDGDLEPLRATRLLAARYGARITVAVMDLSLADVALSAFDRDGCFAAARACVEAGRRYGLATEPVAHLWLAGAHALAGDDDAMQAEVERALAHDPDDPRILGDLYGRVLPTRSFVADDLGALRGQLDTMIGYVRAAPAGTSVFPGRVLWATVHTIEDDDLGAPARAELAEAAERFPVLRDDRDAVEAVALGRQGRAEQAGDLMALARAAMRSVGPMGLGMNHSQQMLAACAAARDGWGDPVGWLRESEAFFAAGGYHRTARRCRTMLGEAGAPVPRRGRGTSTVPPSLRALGVTSRELDVLKLVADGRSNPEIGQRLFVSTKTVERHVSSLLDRTGLRDRRALGELARAHGAVDG